MPRGTPRHPRPQGSQAVQFHLMCHVAVECFLHTVLDSPHGLLHHV